MEEYQNRVNYLRHLKKIAEIRAGSHKSTTALNNANLSKSRTKQSIGPPKSALLQERGEGRMHTSTERIMRNFMVEKENHRLLSKIMHMSSSIPFKRYQKEYQDSKALPFNENRIKRKQNYIYFKLFDINMSLGKASSPDDVYKIYLVQNRKKILLAKDTLFELRKTELKLKKGGDQLLKIEGKDQEGIVRLAPHNLLDILKHGHKIGHVVIEFIKK